MREHNSRSFMVLLITSTYIIKSDLNSANKMSQEKISTSVSHVTR